MIASYTPGPWQWDGDDTLRPVNPDPRRRRTHREPGITTITRIIAASIAAAVLAGCASTAQIYSPVIDPKVGDQSRLHDHLAECRALTDQVGQADTAVAGALFATAIGAMLGARGSTLAGIAGTGALMTGASAAGYAGMTQQQIVQRCLTNRGYAVLD